MITTFYELGNLEPFLTQTNLTLDRVDYEFNLFEGSWFNVFSISFSSPRGTKITIKTHLYPRTKIFAREQFEVFLRAEGRDELVYFGCNTDEIGGLNTRAAVEKALNSLVTRGQKISIQDTSTDEKRLLELDGLV
jgi:hypothetical protein